MKVCLVALIVVAGCDERAAAPVADVEPAPAPIQLPTVDVAWTTPWHGDAIVALGPGPRATSGRVGRVTGRGARLVRAPARASAAEAIASLTGGAWLAVAGAGTPALDLRFGGDPLGRDDHMPVIDLRASGIRVRRADGTAHGEIPWHGDPVDAATVAAAHQHVMAEADPAWRDAAVVTVDAAITVQQLVAILGVLRGDGTTRVALVAP